MLQFGLSASSSLRSLGLQADEKTYRVCDNCGFRLMEVWPPTRRTYPFSVEYCPICGRRRDDRGVYPGRRMSRGAKLAALRRWLREHDLDEELLRRHYHLRLEQFFVEGAL
ncbi:MAG: hypothetical protein GXO56_07505 [Chloroflexi bacterium]|nr:hypothetical protein [Chloroflexota bacterium]